MQIYELMIVIIDMHSGYNGIIIYLQKLNLLIKNRDMKVLNLNHAELLICFK